MAAMTDIYDRLDSLPKRFLDLYREQQALERAREQERLRGVKYIRREGYPGVNQISIDGPEAGFAWNLKLVSVQLSAASAFDVYIGEQQTGTGLANRRQIFNGTATTQTQWVATWSSDQVMLFANDKLNLDAIAGAVNITEFFLCAIQVPAEELGKVLY